MLSGHQLIARLLYKICTPPPLSATPYFPLHFTGRIIVLGPRQIRICFLNFRRFLGALGVIAPKPRSNMFLLYPPPPIYSPPLCPISIYCPPKAFELPAFTAVSRPKARPTWGFW